MVHFRGSRYSVPPDFAGKAVEVVSIGGQILVRCDDLVIAEHHAAARPGQCVVAREHLEQLGRVTVHQVPAPRVSDITVSLPPEVTRMDLRQFEEVRS